jgi:hypothetical protein
LTRIDASARVAPGRCDESQDHWQRPDRGFRVRDNPLSVSCSSENPVFPGLCAFIESATPNVSTTGEFAQTNNCPPTLFVTSFPETQFCTINVTFNPSATGARAGTLTAGGMERPLSGSGLAAPVATVTPVTTAKKKKCKKKKKHH